MNRPHFSAMAQAAVLGAMMVCCPASASDLTRSLTESFPPGIGITPEEPFEDPSLKAADLSFEDLLIELVNQARWDNGQLAPLRRVDLLDTSAETHSRR